MTKQSKRIVRCLVLGALVVPFAYLLLISFIPEDKIVGFHWPR
jgi:ABC-type spermidine/putrescine transport system permease subunit II